MKLFMGLAGRRPSDAARHSSLMRQYQQNDLSNLVQIAKRQRFPLKL